MGCISQWSQKISMEVSAAKTRHTCCAMRRQGCLVPKMHGTVLPKEPCPGIPGFTLQPWMGVGNHVSEVVSAGSKRLIATPSRGVPSVEAVQRDSPSFPHGHHPSQGLLRHLGFWVRCFPLGQGEARMTRCLSRPRRSRRPNRRHRVRHTQGIPMTHTWGPCGFCNCQVLPWRRGEG